MGGKGVRGEKRWKGQWRETNSKSEITVEEAVIFEAAPAEQRMEGVQRLLPLHRLGEGPIDIQGALGGQLDLARRLQKALIPGRGHGGGEARAVTGQSEALREPPHQPLFSNAENMSNSCISILFLQLLHGALIRKQ